MAAHRLSLLGRLRAELRTAGDPEKAKGQQAYMKSAMPYHGVTNPQMRSICKDLYRGYAFADPATWRRDVLSVWRGAEFREERYAAIELASHRGARAFHTMDALPMFEEMIVTGAWWDFVDVLASHDLGEILAREKAPMRRTMLTWSRDRDTWKRRSAILCQLRFKAETDSRASLRVHRALPAEQGVLASQGDWMVAPPARLDRSARGPALRRRERGAPLDAVEARGAQEHRSRHFFPCARSAAKKSFSRCAHSISSTPRVIAKRWFRRVSWPIVKSVVHAPAFGSSQP